MTAEEQTLLNETLSKVFKLDSETLATLYNEAGDLTDLSVVETADTQRTARHNTEKQGQLGRGIKEGAVKIEKELKDKYGESELIGMELFESILVKQVEEASNAKDTDITKHPEFIKLQSSIEGKLKVRDKEWTDKLTLKEAEFNKAVIFDKVKSKALSYLDSAKAILPEDAKKAENWKKTYTNALSEYQYLENDDGTITVLNKDGKVLEDSHSNIRTFDEVIKTTADGYFDFQVAAARSGSGNKGGGQAGPTAGEPKTKEECLVKLRDEKITPEDRMKYNDLMESLKE